MTTFWDQTKKIKIECRSNTELDTIYIQLLFCFVPQLVYLFYCLTAEQLSFNDLYLTHVLSSQNSDHITIVSCVYLSVYVQADFETCRQRSYHNSCCLIELSLMKPATVLALYRVQMYMIWFCDWMQYGCQACVKVSL